MTYNPSTPNGFDKPSDSQDEFLSNFSELNEIFGFDHIPFANRIEEATLDNPCLITSSNHEMEDGDQITLIDMNGNVTNAEGNYLPWSINGNTYTVTLDGDDPDNKFTIPVDTSGFDEYVSNSGSFQVTDRDYGFHKKLTFSNAQSSDPNKLSPIASLFTKVVPNIYFARSRGPGGESDDNQLIFQNGNSVDLLRFLTGVDFKLADGFLGFGFRTGFGLIFNMGRKQITPVAQAVTLPYPYSSTNYTVITSRASKQQLSNEGLVTAQSTTTITLKSSVSDVTDSIYFFSVGT